LTPDYSAWRVAYARQALADLHARDALLKDRRLPPCQELHFLQMACEKICKAYLCGTGGVELKKLQKSHAFISGNLHKIVRQWFMEESTAASHLWAMRAIRSLAYRIELLAPSVDKGGRHPANCEYPWAGSDGKVKAPCDHVFEFDLLYEKAGRLLLKALYSAASDLQLPKSPA
jgi:hypothetical protein